MTMYKVVWLLLVLMSLGSIIGTIGLYMEAGATIREMSLERARTFMLLAYGVGALTMTSVWMATMLVYAQ